jgi:hypothetical protein
VFFLTWAGAPLLIHNFQRRRRSPSLSASRRIGRASLADEAEDWLPTPIADGRQIDGLH